MLLATALPVAAACHMPLPPLFLARSSFDICSGCGWWRAFGNCSLGPAASVLPIVRGLCKIVIGSQLVAAVVGQLSRSGRHANVAAAAVAAVVTVV